MDLLESSDTTSLSYWLNWRFFLCTIWVFIPMLGATFIIWKYEYSYPPKPDEEGTQEDDLWFRHANNSWMPCVKQIHPICLMMFRIFSFFLILTALVVDVVVRGGSLFHYYTQWTLALVAIYFGFGSLLSIYGCLQHWKIYSGSNACNEVVDAEQGSHVSLIQHEAVTGVDMGKYPYYQEKYYHFRTASSLVYQVSIFLLSTATCNLQVYMTAGAVILTDCLYWCVIFPFLTIKDYDFNFFTVMEHSLNAILLISETTLNGLQFPWFRISYFILLTGVYVIFEWIVHASVSMWWPYPFLDLSIPSAPVWYLAVALMHLPCYALFALIIKAKYYMLHRWFPQVDRSLR
ncbi:uncharacterized protein LOC141683628 isoform X3 [Apium graveolens]|uniref:uncharacterized protein LOC141683628 isoform X3 n=1 Tax=Apium graveolens TaxID=4045 RepID=UPI003D7B170E